MPQGPSKHISRERIALLIFAIFIIASGVFLSFYFFIGKQLSTTATVVDDVTGNMQDYTIVVFAGTAKGQTVTDSIKGDDAYAASLGQSAATSLKTFLADAYLRAHVKTNQWRNHVFVSDVRQDYELKGAEVSTIDISSTSNYSKPSIVDAGRKKIGVFSISKYLSRARLKAIVDSLIAKGAESIVCITKKPSLLSSYNGLNVVVSLTKIDDDDKNAAGSTLLIDSPAKGDVGAILFSNANVISYRTAKTL